MAKLTIAWLFVLFAAIIVSDSTVSANVECACPNGRSWAIESRCYCGPEADKIETCVRAIAPNWPFAGDKPSGASPPADTSSCPDPVQDPTGFSSCVSKKVNDSVPKSLGNAGKIAQDCAASTKAVPQNGQGQPGADVKNGQSGATGRSETTGSVPNNSATSRSSASVLSFAIGVTAAIAAIAF